MYVYKRKSCLWRNVKDMASMYYNCSNLTGAPVCGENVVNMSSAYSKCVNLTGDFMCGSKVTNIYSIFSNIPNICGNHFYDNVSILNTVTSAYHNKDNSHRLNIFINLSINNMFNKTSGSTIFGFTNITWINITDENGTGYYNTMYNTYIYPA